MLIQGESMEPEYHNMQLVVLDVRSKSYETGDVIAFKCDGLEAVLVKRIAAEPGDIVSIENGTLKINGQESSMYQDVQFEYSGMISGSVEVPSDCYFVLGDNIQESVDSRYSDVGFVNKTKIIGEVLSAR